MIKFVVFFALLHLSVSQQQNCRSDTDCNADECCTSSFVGRRRRFIFDNVFGSSGTCKPLAQEGHICEPDMLNVGGLLSHSFGCPCTQGLECHGEKESHRGGSHSYTNPKCLPAGTYTGGSGTGTGTGSTGTGSGTAMPATQGPPSETEAPLVVDTNQPIQELPGKFKGHNFMAVC